jgi:hypothetical protein
MQHHTPGPDSGQREKAVFRTVPIPVTAFDHIKDFQRATQASTGQAVTFNEALTLIVRQHKQLTTQNEAHGATRHDRAAAHSPRIPAILR